MALSILYQPHCNDGQYGPQRPLHASAFALQEFLAAHYDHLRRRLTQHLGCADRATESLNDAWLRLGDTLAETAIYNPEAYIYRMACNLATDNLRESRTSQYAPDAETVLSSLADDVPGPAQIAEARSECARVEYAMQGLSRRQRAVLVALRIDDMDRRDVATRYGLSIHTVDTTLRHALRGLQG